MKLLNEWEMNKWAFNECLNGNDIPEMRKLITHSVWSFYYCHCIKDISEIRKNISACDLHSYKNNMEMKSIIDDNIVIFSTRKKQNEING